MGATIDFLLSARRDAAAAKAILPKGLAFTSPFRSKIINVDENLSYQKVIAELKQTGTFGWRCRRPARSVFEQQDLR